MDVEEWPILLTAGRMVIPWVVFFHLGWMQGDGTCIKWLTKGRILTMEE